jgi:hypothetical protein
MRKSRNNESREYESRDHEENEGRSFYNNDYVGILEIPKSVIKEDHDYYYERRSLKGQIDSALEIAYSKKWRPIEVSRDTSRFDMGLYDSDDVAKKYICKGDAILLERPSEIGHYEKRALEDLSIKRAKDSNAYKFKDTDPTANSLDKN